MSLGVGVACELYSAPYCNTLPPTCTFMNDIQCAYLSRADAQKTLLDPYPQSNRKSAILMSSAIFNKFMPRSLTISYRFNTTVFTVSVPSSCLEDEKLLKAFDHVIPGGHGGSQERIVCASILCHIHSATHWTQEVRQTSPNRWHLLLVFSTSYTTT